jgi:lactam utilization protein B
MKKHRLLTLDMIAKDMAGVIWKIKDLEKKLSLMGATQSAIIDTVAEDNPVFMRKLMSTVFADDDFRNDFTEFINRSDAPDDVKVFMMGMNEHMSKQEEE